MKRNPPSKAKSTSGNGSLLETGENFSFGSGRLYADNAEYARESLAFDVLEIVREAGRGYDGKDRWAITVKAADRECEILTLGCNPKRDGELSAAREHLARGGAISNKRLRRSGDAYYLTDGGR